MFSTGVTLGELTHFIINVKPERAMLFEPASRSVIPVYDWMEVRSVAKFEEGNKFGNLLKLFVGKTIDAIHPVEICKCFWFKFDLIAHCQVIP
jgi:hypothetical protein